MQKCKFIGSGAHAPATLFSYFDLPFHDFVYAALPELITLTTYATSFAGEKFGSLSNIKSLRKKQTARKREEQEE